MSRRAVPPGVRLHKEILREAKASRPKRSKYRNVPTVVDGVRFASKAEAKRDAELQLLHQQHKIIFLRRQPRFDLIVRGQKICTYVGDFEYLDGFDPGGNPIRVVEDRKGVLTAAFKLKWRLCKALHPEIEWRLS